MTSRRYDGRIAGSTLDHSQYLIVMLGCLVLTLPLEFAFGARVWRQPKRLATAVLPAFCVFVAWDVFATNRGTWDFSDRYTIGVDLPGGVAIEELLFFIVIPICTLLTLESVRRVLARETPVQRWLKAR